MGVLPTIAFVQPLQRLLCSFPSISVCNQQYAENGTYSCCSLHLRCWWVPLHILILVHITLILLVWCTPGWFGCAPNDGKLAPCCSIGCICICCICICCCCMWGFCGKPIDVSNRLRVESATTVVPWGAACAWAMAAPLGACADSCLNR